MTILLPILQDSDNLDSRNTRPDAALALKLIKETDEVALTLDGRTVMVSADEFLNAARAIAGRDL